MCTSEPGRTIVCAGAPPSRGRAVTGMRQPRPAPAIPPSWPSVRNRPEPGPSLAMISTLTSGTPACSVKSWAMPATGRFEDASMARQRSAFEALP